MDSYCNKLSTDVKWNKEVSKNMYGSFGSLCLTVCTIRLEKTHIRP